MIYGIGVEIGEKLWYDKAEDNFNFNAELKVDNYLCNKAEFTGKFCIG